MVTTPGPEPEPTISVCAGSEDPGAEPADVSLLLDLRGDGSADDLVEGFFTSAGWPRMRVTTAEGVYSEVIGVIDGRYRPLGTAPIFPGGPNELVAAIGDGSDATEVGFFTLDATDCLTPFSAATAGREEFSGFVRSGPVVRESIYCFDGGIGLTHAEEDVDGTWIASGAAYELDDATSIRYMPVSDDYSEGLAENEVAPGVFDCFGLSL